MCLFSFFIAPSSPYFNVSIFIFHLWTLEVAQSDRFPMLKVESNPRSIHTPHTPFLREAGKSTFKQRVQEVSRPPRARGGPQREGCEGNSFVNGKLANVHFNQDVHLIYIVW